ncbi:MAG: hypothetical protein M3256_12470 [Actinomycetota bacterium]|nr:hypothetical protein [Actinomycetota bacterium]
MDKRTGAQRRSPADLEWLDSYRPQRIGGDVWLAVRPFVVDGAVTLGLDDGAGARRVVRVLAQLGAWAVAEGLPLDVEVVLDPDTVERFVAVGLADDRSRATYRAVLRRVGPRLTRRAPWEARAATVARRQVAVPYTVDEIRGLRDDAFAPDRWSGTCAAGPVSPWCPGWAGWSIGGSSHRPRYHSRPGGHGDGGRPRRTSGSGAG